MKILSLLILLIFISCEAPVDSEPNPNTSPSDSSVEYERIQLSDTYNFNGYDYSVRLLDAEEASKYTNANNVYELTRDDGLETIVLRNRVWPNNISAVESTINWHSDLPGVPTYKSKKGTIDFNEDSFTICRDEEDHSDPFNPVYVEVCDEFRSI